MLRFEPRFELQIGQSDVVSVQNNIYLNLCVSIPDLDISTSCLSQRLDYIVV